MRMHPVSLSSLDQHLVTPAPTAVRTALPSAIKPRQIRLTPWVYEGHAPTRFLRPLVDSTRAGARGRRSAVDPGARMARDTTRRHLGCQRHSDSGWQNGYSLNRQKPDFFENFPGRSLEGTRRRGPGVDLGCRPSCAMDARPSANYVRLGVGAKRITNIVNGLSTHLAHLERGSHA